MEKQWFSSKRQRWQSIWQHNRQLIYNIAGSGVIRCISIGVAVFSMPAYMGYFNDNSVLGVWLAMLSVLTMVSVMDFGLGNGLRNHLTTALVKKDWRLVRQLISSSYIIICLICLLLGGMGFFLIPCLPWNLLLGIQTNIVGFEMLVLVIRWVYLAIIFQMVLRTVTAILYACQQAALVGMLSLFSNITMVLYALFATSTIDAGVNLLHMAKVYLLAANIPYLLSTVLVFTGKMRLAVPSYRDFNWQMSQKILRLGMVFFYLIVASLIIHNTNDILIAALFDSSLVVEFQIYNKVFFFVITVANVLLVPLWSAVTKAYAEGNIPWMRKLHTWLCLSAGVSLIAGLAVMSFMQVIVDFWLRERAIQIETLYCLPFVFYVAIDAVNGANATIANGANWLKAQVMMAPINIILNIGLTIFMAKTYQHWTMIPLANVLSLIPVAIVQFIYIRRKFTELEQRSV